MTVNISYTSLEKPKIPNEKKPTVPLLHKSGSEHLLSRLLKNLSLSKTSNIKKPSKKPSISNERKINGIIQNHFDSYVEKNLEVVMK